MTYIDIGNRIGQSQRSRIYRRKLYLAREMIADKILGGLHGIVDRFTVRPSQRTGFFCPDCTPGSQQLKSALNTNDPGQTLRGTITGHDTEIDFRLGKHKIGPRYAGMACHGKLRTPAHDRLCWMGDIHAPDS